MMRRVVGQLVLICLIIPNFCQADEAPSIRSHRPFIHSFLRQYGFGMDERYGHEYHHYLLEKTSKSLDTLEHTLQNAGFSTPGRMVIMGYEGNAFPSYFTNFRDCEGYLVNDEEPIKSTAGWSSRPNNRFGFMTGYLFRSIKNDNAVLSHMGAKGIELYDDALNLFQKDAFGAAYPLLKAAEKALVPTVVAGDYHGMFDVLTNFWNKLYKSAARTGNKEVACTQDILFTREHACYLSRTAIPLKKFYVGSDLTYPIISSSRCLPSASHNAQQFVKEFAQQLVPHNGESTVFVFNSFVDGVGKSTMLGNIKNWMKHGADVLSYDVTDNTSSQVADMYTFADNVYIADLPAQLSHFTHKPDGYVYVDARSVQGAHCYEDARQYYLNNAKKLFAEYEALKISVKKTIDTSGWFDPSLEDAQKPTPAFIKNLFLLKKHDKNLWIPFEYQGCSYLVHRQRTGDVRVFMTLGEAQSSGLKNVSMEQMLFLGGVKMPLDYDVFLDDLIAKCRARGVKHIIYVDFLSMYSRSSRENIRVNYLMQQMALLSSDFAVDDTLYRELSSNSELFYLLKNPKWYQSCAQNFTKEVLARCALDAVREQFSVSQINGMLLPEITRRLKGVIDAVSEEDHAYIAAQINEKMACEVKALESVYGMTKEFVNIHSFSTKALCALSHEIEMLFSQGVENVQLNDLWSNLGGMVIEESLDLVEGPVDIHVSLEGNVGGRAVYMIHDDNRNTVILSSLFRLVRASWYAVLGDLVTAECDEQTGRIVIEEPTPLLPLIVRRGTKGNLYLIQPLILEVEREQVDEDEVQEIAKQCAGLVDPQATRWGIFGENYYPLDVMTVETWRGGFAFGCNPIAQERAFPYMYAVMDQVLKKVRQSGQQKDDQVVPMATVVREFESMMRGRYRMVSDMIAKQTQHQEKKTEGHEEKSGGDEEKIEENTKKKKDKKLQANETAQTNSEQDQYRARYEPKKLFYARQDQYQQLQVYARFVATLEMVVRDVNSDIVIRRDREEDFAGALRIVEQVILPQHFGIVCAEPLFKNPVPPLVSKFDF